MGADTAVDILFPVSPISYTCARRTPPSSAPIILKKKQNTTLLRGTTPNKMRKNGTAVVRYCCSKANHSCRQHLHACHRLAPRLTCLCTEVDPCTHHFPLITDGPRLNLLCPPFCCLHLRRLWPQHERHATGQHYVSSEKRRSHTLWTKGPNQRALSELFFSSGRLARSTQRTCRLLPP